MSTLAMSFADISGSIVKYIILLKKKSKLSKNTCSGTVYRELRKKPVWSLPKREDVELSPLFNTNTCIKITSLDSVVSVVPLATLVYSNDWRDCDWSLTGMTH